MYKVLLVNDEVLCVASKNSSPEDSSFSKAAAWFVNRDK